MKTKLDVVKWLMLNGLFGSLEREESRGEESSGEESLDILKISKGEGSN